MTNNALVIIFPSIFAQNKINVLISNIKKILSIQNQSFQKIRKDDSLIVVEANDPVFASSTINLLFGIKKVAIAKQIKNEYDVLVSSITKIGSNLLLKGDTFYVKVEGESKGYLPKDIEFAATSSLIEKTSKLGAKPGTEDKHDKLLYTYLTKLNAYVCIFTDKGNGGIPNNFQNEKIICCIYDELSSVSCLETIKAGFDVKIIVCYNKESDLLKFVKILNALIPRMLKSKIELEFFKVDITNSSSKKYLELIETVTEIMISVNSSNKVNRLSLALSPIIFPQSFIDKITKRISQNNIIPYMSLSGFDENVLNYAKELGLEKYLTRIEKLGKLKFNSVLKEKNNVKELAQKAIKTKRSVRITVGPNNIHDILDSLKSEH
ncbi:MAG: thiamine biosynthesis protein [Nitrosopumilaceae archaeon]